MSDQQERKGRHSRIEGQKATPSHRKKTRGESSSSEGSADRSDTSSSKSDDEATRATAAAAAGASAGADTRGGTSSRSTTAAAATDSGSGGGAVGAGELDPNRVGRHERRASSGSGESSSGPASSPSVVAGGGEEQQQAGSRRSGGRPERPPGVQTRQPTYLDPKLIESMKNLGVTETAIISNYYSLSFLKGARIASDIKFHRYDVLFEPNVPRMYRQGVMDMFIEQHFKEAPIGYDGNAMVFIPADAANRFAELMQPSTAKVVNVNKINIDKVTITLNKTTEEPLVADQGVQFMQALNTCLKRILCRRCKLKPFLNSLWDTSEEGMERVEFFDRNSNKTNVYYLMRGYDITIKALQNGFFINLDDRIRVVKEGTVLDWMGSTRKTSPNDYKKIIEDRMRNQIVMNTIGMELIRVAAIHFDQSPSTYKFNWRRPGQKEEEITIQEYYKRRYNKDCIGKQPLIEALPPQKLPANATLEQRQRFESRKQLIPAQFLVFTGLDESEKANFFLMKRLNESTKPSSLKKKVDLDETVKKYLLNDNVRDDMRKLKIELSIVSDIDQRRVPAQGLANSLVGRLIRPPEIDMGAGKMMTANVTEGPNGPMIQFEPETRSKGPVIKHQENYKIALISTERDVPVLKTFYEDCVIKAASGMSMRDVFEKPQTFLSRGQKSADFSAAIEDCRSLCKSRNFTPFMFVCLPDDNKERYDQVKQVSLANYGFLSQCMKMRTIQKPMLSVGTKIVMQVLSKMGTIKWALNKPRDAGLFGAMRASLIVGLDVHHDSERRGSVQACVGTLDARASVFYQRTRLVAAGEEISLQSSAYSLYITDMIRERNARGGRTETIIVYRDGVSEGQIEAAINTEYVQLKKTLDNWPSLGDCPYTQTNVPKIIFIFVMKRHSTRFFQFNPDGATVDEPPGGGERGRGARTFQPKRFGNPKPGTVVSRGIVRSDRAEFYMSSHDTKEGVLVPIRYEILKNETIPPAGMSQGEATKMGYPAQPVTQETLEDLTFYLTALYPNQCATIRVPVVCQLAQKLAMLSGQHLHSDVVDLQAGVLRTKPFYL